MKNFTIRANKSISEKTIEEEMIKPQDIDLGELEDKLIDIFRKSELGFKNAGDAWSQLQFRDISNSLAD